MTVHRPPCPKCEGSGYHSTSLGKTIYGFNCAGQIRKMSGLTHFYVKRRCTYCGGRGRVHPDQLESYLRTVVIEEDGR